VNFKYTVKILDNKIDDLRNDWPHMKSISEFRIKELEQVKKILLEGVGYLKPSKVGSGSKVEFFKDL